ncbi:MAG: zinc ribbon domain-containing protein [Thermofilaceae archaeon]
MGNRDRGFRVFKPRLNREERRQFAKLYWRLIDRDPTLPRCCFLYYESWKAMDYEAEKRRKRRKRWRRPPYYLKVKFMKWGTLIHGSRSAPVVIDLTGAELRIPCAGIRVGLQPSIVKALEEDLRLQPKPSFVFQLCSNGRARIIAFRDPASGVLPRRVISLDLNSSYGLAGLIIDFDEEGRVLRVIPRRWQPPNTALHEAIVAALQSAAERGTPKAVLERLPNPELKEKVEKALKRFGTLTTERASALARKVKRDVRKLHRVWIEKTLNELRHLVREVNGQVAILIDVPSEWSLRGTQLQRTLRRIRRYIENMARYEGAQYTEVRSSGKRCPLCNSPCEEVANRYFGCSNCGIIADRDYNACFRAAARMFPRLKEWLREHPKALAANFHNPNNPVHQPHSNGPRSPAPRRPLSRDTHPGVEPGGAPGGPRDRRGGEPAGMRTGDGARKGGRVHP